MNIGGKGKVQEALSNFTAYEFYLDGVRCNSMEGFIQSLKFSDIEKQKEVCLLVGKDAKFKGKKKKWWKTQTLHWLGVVVDRHSEEYQFLLRRAFTSLSENVKFSDVLLKTVGKKLRHAHGKKDPNFTILTEEELCSILTEIREKLKDKKK